MSVEQLISAAQRLSASVDALAALGAELRLRRNGKFAPPRVRQLVQEVLHAIDPHLLEGITADQEAAALAAIESLFRQASDLLENPERGPGWTYTDPKLLQGLGTASRRFARAMEAFAAGRSALGAALKAPGKFLDVGTGGGRARHRSCSILAQLARDRHRPLGTLACACQSQHRGGGDGRAC